MTSRKPSRQVEKDLDNLKDGEHQNNTVIENAEEKRGKRKATPKQAEHLKKAREKAAETRKRNAEEKRAQKEKQSEDMYKKSVRDAALELLKSKGLCIDEIEVKEEIEEDSLDDSIDDITDHANRLKAEKVITTRRNASLAPTARQSTNWYSFSNY
ncbi:hypothetical protein HK097_006300 [Rhizophlyctis rosea]|uniref:Uncharacterized protein n=1 Tax=Rhizophlyctis rosea TaxID=64517 RepID=A0AAD5RZJ5_9FUNG|nr:hypothetical protein HK097_006300 [Rhizophlyctis rosea]